MVVDDAVPAEQQGVGRKRKRPERFRDD